MIPHVHNIFTDDVIIACFPTGTVSHVRKPAINCATRRCQKKRPPLVRLNAHSSWERKLTVNLIVGVDVKGRQQHVLNARGVGIVLAVALV